MLLGKQCACWRWPLVVAKIEENAILSDTNPDLVRREPKTNCLLRCCDCVLVGCFGRGERASKGRRCGCQGRVAWRVVCSTVDEKGANDAFDYAGASGATRKIMRSRLTNHSQLQHAAGRCHGRGAWQQRFLGTSPCGGTLHGKLVMQAVCPHSGAAVLSMARQDGRSLRGQNAAARHFLRSVTGRSFVAKNRTDVRFTSLTCQPAVILINFSVY